MLAQVVRRGVVEATHAGAVAAVQRDGNVVAAQGRIEECYLIRSAAKPFQVKIAQSLGADLVAEQIAVGAGSHGGQPIHLAYVRAMLAQVGLDEGALQCPAEWPIVDGATSRLARLGHPAARRIFHNCSGKHAAMLRACVAQGWPTETYLSPRHPLQEANRAELERMTGEPAGDPAVDGCGAPVFEVSTLGVARAFARLGTDPEYGDVWQAMHRFGALTSDWGEVPAALSQWADVAAKAGAEGLIAISTRADLGVAVKSQDGSNRPLGPAVLATFDQLGLTSQLTRAYAEERLRRLVLGGGEPVGSLEPLVRLS